MKCAFDAICRASFTAALIAPVAGQHAAVGLVGRMPRDQYRPRRASQQAFRGRAQHQALQKARAASAHHQQPGVERLRLAHDLVQRRAGGMCLPHGDVPRGMQFAGQLPGMLSGLGLQALLHVAAGAETATRFEQAAARQHVHQSQRCTGLAGQARGAVGGVVGCGREDGGGKDGAQGAYRAVSLS